MISHEYYENSPILGSRSYPLFQDTAVFTLAFGCNAPL